VDEWIATGIGDGGRAESVLCQLRRYRWSAPENAVKGATSSQDLVSTSEGVCGRSFVTNDPAAPVEQLTFHFVGREAA
jgi:hypothetical protein